jgi:hypothetical protein
MCWTPRGYRVFVPEPIWAELTASQRAAVLRHELAHLHRRDLWLALLARLLALPHWFNPFAWWAVYRFTECAEWACDQSAAGPHHAAATDYAKALLRLGAAGPASPSCATAVRGGSLFIRIRRVISAPFAEDSLMEKATILLAAAVLVALNVVRVELVAKELAASQEQGLTHSGKVTDKTTGEPIAAATVTVRRSIVSSWEERQLQETKHQTDAEGNYTFTIPPEQVAERYLYIELDVVHPDYAPQKGFGYSLGMIRKNEKLGGRPFFAHVRLQQAEHITGTVVRPDGTPAAELKVLAYSKADPQDLSESDYGSFDDTKTDEKGVFRLNLVRGGKAVFWLLPKDYVPSTHVIDKKRGNLGRLVLEEGTSIRGRVLDVDGQPIRAVYVNAELEKGAAKKDIGMPVVDAIRRSAITDEQGRFVTGPLPPGEYRVIPDDYPHDSLLQDRTRRPLAAVFFPQMVTVKEGRPSERIEIRAVPHVTIEAQYVDASGKPCRGHSVDLFGTRDGIFYSSQGRPDHDGRISFKAPKGLAKAALSLHTNEHGVLRYRISKDAPLQNAERLELGTLDKDFTGLIIVRYEAPILVVKALGQDGRIIEGFKPRIDYPPGTTDRDPTTSHWISGVEGDVDFEKQEDGRWRSSQLLPDQPFTLTLEAEGYQQKSDKFTLAEGAIKEIEWRLTKQ